MNLASAYPNSDLSAGALVALVLVVAVCVTFWIVMVFRADKSTAHDTRQAKSYLNVAEPNESAEDEHSDADGVSAGRRHETAA